MSGVPYRLPATRTSSALVHDDASAAEWRRLRRYRLWALFGFVGVAVTFALAPHVERWSLILGFPSALSLGCGSIGIGWFACPGCREAFFAKHWFWGPHHPFMYFRRHCLHCGLAVGAPKVDKVG